MQDTLIKFGELIQLFGGLFMIATYIPQIIMLHKNKSAENQSLPFWYMLIVSLTTFFVNSIILLMYKGVWSVFITQFFNLGLALVVLGQILYYRKKNK